MSSQDSWPLDSQRHLEDALREQGETPDGIAELLPAMQRLSSWQAPVPSAGDMQRMLAKLLPAISPVRQVIRSRYRSSWHRLHLFLDVAVAQVSILQPSFWVLSLLITFFGLLFLASAVQEREFAFLLGMIGPLVAYLGTMNIFRARQQSVLEFELACPPSLQQLTLARLIVVLGYNIIVGLPLSVLLTGRFGDGFLPLTLHWLAPMLFVTGLALPLSLRMSFNLAATCAYGVWFCYLVLTMVAISPFSGHIISPITSSVELVIGLIGLALLAVTILRLPRYTQLQLP